MSDLLTYALAAGMGLVLGSILGVPQWLALRRRLSKAGWWILANMFARLNAGHGGHLHRNQLHSTVANQRPAGAAVAAVRVVSSKKA